MGLAGFVRVLQALGPPQKTNLAADDDDDDDDDDDVMMLFSC